MRLMTWAVSDTGRARKANEDSYLLAPDLGLVAVADGMGGFQRGDVASELACGVLREVVAEGQDVVGRFRQEPTDAHKEAVLELFEDAVQQACRQVHEASFSLVGEGGRMGTTMDAIMLVGHTGFLVHVGDGRVYLHRGGELHQLTEDHSLVQEQLRAGVMTEEQARRSRKKNVITRALGVFGSVLVDSLAFEVDPRDTFVLCSDGLHRYIGRRELGFVVNEADAEAAVRKLVAMANERGGRDNITVAFARPRPEAPEESAEESDEEPVQAWMDALRRVDIFQASTYRQLLSFTQAAHERAVSGGEVVFEDGAPGDELYIVLSGEVAIEKQGTRLALIGPSHYFGEMAILDRSRRSATARAVMDTRLLAIDRESFLQLLRQDPALGSRLLWQMLRKLAHHLRATNERLVAETITLEELDDWDMDVLAPVEPEDTSDPTTLEQA